MFYIQKILKHRKLTVRRRRWVSSQQLNISTFRIERKIGKVSKIVLFFFCFFFFVEFLVESRQWTSQKSRRAFYFITICCFSIQFYFSLTWEACFSFLETNVGKMKLYGGYRSFVFWYRWHKKIYSFNWR